MTLVVLGLASSCSSAARKWAMVEVMDALPDDPDSGSSSPTLCGRRVLITEGAGAEGEECPGDGVGMEEGRGSERCRPPMLFLFIVKEGVVRI